MTQEAVAFDRSRPTNSVESAAKYIGVSRGLAYQQARTGAWPSLRVGSRILIKTKPFLAMIGETDQGEG
jgi:excisionase family DNA binding protein